MTFCRRGGARRLLLPALLLIALAAPAGASALRMSSFPPVAGNPADRLADHPADPYAYDHATRCRTRPQAGALAMSAWLRRNAGGRFWGIMRCSKLGARSYSLHAEGRAIDWHLDYRRRADRREARRLIGLLLATDRNGTPHALARRMGIQEIIWDCSAWWSGGSGLRPYRPCFKADGSRNTRVGATIAHRDHIHFGLNKRGARKLTSFWAR